MCLGCSACDTKPAVVESTGTGNALLAMRLGTREPTLGPMNEPTPSSSIPKGPLTVHFHRDFDGMCAGALLTYILRERGEGPIQLSSINYDQRHNWDSFGEGTRFAIVDFHFHPRAAYWFDHHPTTFLTPTMRAQYEPNDRWRWNDTSPSCPPMILDHAREYWAFDPPERFLEMATWSDIVDAARYESVDQAVFGDQAALRLTRSLTVSPDPGWVDELAEALVEGDLESVAGRADVEKAHERASRNRDKALEHFPSTIKWMEGGVIYYDASSSRVRRERFASFYHHPDAHYAVGVIPTRAGFHVTCGENPWNPPKNRANIGEMMEKHGGGGHMGVGGANPPDLQTTRMVAEETAGILVSHLARHARA